MRSFAFIRLSVRSLIRVQKVSIIRILGFVGFGGFGFRIRIQDQLLLFGLASALDGCVQFFLCSNPKPLNPKAPQTNHATARGP